MRIARRASLRSTFWRQAGNCAQGGSPSATNSTVCVAVARAIFRTRAQSSSGAPRTAMARHRTHRGHCGHCGRRGPVALAAVATLGFQLNREYASQRRTVRTVRSCGVGSLNGALNGWHASTRLARSHLVTGVSGTRRRGSRLPPTTVHTADRQRQPAAQGGRGTRLFQASCAV